MRSLGVVKLQLSVRIGLQSVERFVKLLPKRKLEKLVQYGSIESLNKTVGLRSSDAARAVRDVVQFQVNLKRV